MKHRIFDRIDAEMGTFPMAHSLEKIMLGAGLEEERLPHFFVP